MQFLITLKINLKIISIQNPSITIIKILIIIEITNNKKFEKIYNNIDEKIVNIQRNLLESIPKERIELCHKQIYFHSYKIHYNTHSTEIFNWLYLWTFENAFDIEELKRINQHYIKLCFWML